MTCQVTVSRFLSSQKAIVYFFQLPQLPKAVTDNAGNTYTRHAESSEDAHWYTMASETLPTLITFTYVVRDDEIEKSLRDTRDLE